MNALELIYSEDDDGWYWQKFDYNSMDWQTSQLFDTKLEAEEAHYANKLEWE